MIFFNGQLRLIQQKNVTEEKIVMIFSQSQPFFRFDYILLCTLPCTGII